MYFDDFKKIEESNQSPYILVPPFFLSCVYQYTTAASRQITPTIICNKLRHHYGQYYNTFIEWSVLCYFLCIEANGSCVTFVLECLQTIVNTYINEMKMMFLNDTHFFLDYAEV